MEERYYQDKLNSSLISAEEGNFLLPMESVQYSMIQPAVGVDEDHDMSDLQIVENLN